MKIKKDFLVDEQTSPLFRIMWIYNYNEPSERKFDNNICSFHIGNGYFLSVAHNLRTEPLLLHSMDEGLFQNEILKKVNPNLRKLFIDAYYLDTYRNKRFIQHINENVAQQLIHELNQIDFDKRWINLYKENICKPFVIIQFRKKEFYNNQNLTSLFNPQNYFYEPELFRHTFILELEVVETYYNEDIALYKIKDADKKIIDSLPVLEIDYSLLDISNESLFCLQSAPIDNLGRLINEAKMEGLLDHWNLFMDRFGGNYVMEGLRYLIKGYFRFGSSGAPYLTYDTDKQKYKVNAIQSEASPIQLTINNNRDGNFQFINAIATPLINVQEKLSAIISKS